MEILKHNKNVTLERILCEYIEEEKNILKYSRGEENVRFCN